jgi:hypothetical protein
MNLQARATVKNILNFMGNLYILAALEGCFEAGYF